MLLRRLVHNVKDQNWTAIALDFAIVVIGVFIAYQVTNWTERRTENHRLHKMVDALRADMINASRIERELVREIRSGLMAFDLAYAQGDRPPPFTYQIAGSDTAPDFVWNALQEAGISELVDPQLLFELANFYSERDGIGAKTVRYMTSIEADILPYLDGDVDYFYIEGTTVMKPEYLASMDRLREWSDYLAALGPWSECFQQRLENADRPGASCFPSYMAKYEGSASF